MKFMNKKRFGAAVMAGALALSLSAPAFAASNPTTTIEGAYTEIPISVVVPESGTAQINPYGLPVSIVKSDETTAQIVDQKITTMPLSIRNTGTTPLNVGATVTVKPSDSITISSSAVTTETTKKMQIGLEVAPLNDAKYALAAAENATLEDLIITAFADDATWASLAAANKVAVTAADTAATGAKVATLGAATVNGDTITYGNDSIALFRLAGDVVKAPKKADNSADPWVETDTFSATVVFTFEPAKLFAVTIGTVTGGTVTASKTSAQAGDEVVLTATPTTTGQSPTYTVKKADGTVDASVTVNAAGKLTMPAYAITIDASFS